MPLSFPGSPTVGQTSAQNGRTYVYTSYGTWELTGNVAGHAASHATGGSDALALAASQITSGQLDIARIPTGSTSSTVCVGNDARLSDARTPTSHTHSASEITSGVIATARLGTGTADSTTFLRGDGSWQTPAGGGSGSVDVYEFATPASFPATGQSAVIYVATDTGRTYRWVGGQYAEVGPSGGIAPLTSASDILTGTLDIARLPASVVLTGDSRLSDSREWSAATVTQSDAEAGTATSRVAWTVQRVWQAISAWWAASAAKTKLDGIAAGATANATDAQLRDRSTHTGTQEVGTITGLGALATQNSVAYSSLTGTPSTFAPAAHASSHAADGSDALTLTAAQISDFSAAVSAAAPATTNASLLTSGTLADARLTANVVLTNDSRLASDGSKGDITVSGNGSAWAINAGAVTAADIANGAVTNLKIADMDASKLTGTIASARLGSGVASSATYLRGDQTWASVASGTSMRYGSVLLFG